MKELNHLIPIFPLVDIQTQPPRGVPRKSCFENMQQIYIRSCFATLSKSHFGMQLY